MRVRFNGLVVADSSRALALREGSYPTVLYIPRADADMTLLHRSARTSHCPHKGDANYFGLQVDGRVSADAAWTYEAPKPEVADIAGHLAFYPDRVDAIEELDG
ncbi:MAG: DUF427 domain-containing protein [Geminicoccaceae bacterium]